MITKRRMRILFRSKGESSVGVIVVTRPTSSGGTRKTSITWGMLLRAPSVCTNNIPVQSENRLRVSYLHCLGLLTDFPSDELV